MSRCGALSTSSEGHLNLKCSLARDRHRAEHTPLNPAKDPAPSYQCPCQAVWQTHVRHVHVNAAHRNLVETNPSLTAADCNLAAFIKFHLNLKCSLAGERSSSRQTHAFEPCQRSSTSYQCPCQAVWHTHVQHWHVDAVHRNPVETNPSLTTADCSLVAFIKFH